MLKATVVAMCGGESVFQGLGVEGMEPEIFDNWEHDFNFRECVS